MLILTFLGGFVAQNDTNAGVSFRSSKVRALLAYLAVEAERPHTRASLAAHFWPDQSEDMALRNLSQALVHLRASIGDVQTNPPLLHITRQTLQWNRESESWLDVADFTRLAHSNDPADLAKAATLYKGEFLQGFSLPGCETFEEWLLLTCAHLERLALQVLDTLVRVALASGDNAQAIQYAHRQLAIDPWRETAYRQLMIALAHNGQRSAALAQYERCRDVLRDALCVEPDSLTTQLFEQIKNNGLSRASGERLAPDPTQLVVTAVPLPPRSFEDWDEAPDLGSFFGREYELETTTPWLVQDKCRLVAITGLGGVGKTTLAAQLSQQVASHFEAVVWRSLLNAPPLADLVRTVLASLSAQQLTNFPTTLDEQIDLLLQFLRQRRCLLVLDNAESLLQSGATTPSYRPGYADYGHLLTRLGQMRHNSCIVLTSREEPPEFTRLLSDASGQRGAVRVLNVRGLGNDAAEAILRSHGVTSANTAPLVQFYSGHPLALKLVANTIRDLYAGDATAFLDEDTPIFADIRMVLDEQFGRLTPQEQDILIWLAIAREPVPMATLRTDLLPTQSREPLLESVRSLRRRSLLETHGEGLTLQHVVMEYLTARLIHHVVDELTSGVLDWTTRYALLKTDVKEYVRQSQVRLIVQPTALRFAQTLGEDGVRMHVAQLLDRLRETPRAPNYAAGNLLNLLLTLGLDVRGYDFSHLCVWHAHLRDVYAPGINFMHADLKGAVFTDTFASVTNVQFTANGSQLVGSCADGTLRVWRVSDGQPLGVFTGHTGVVWSVATSPDGQLVASGGADHSVRLWDGETGQELRVFHGHSHVVEIVTFSPDGRLLASGGADQTVQLWDVATGQRVLTLKGHRGSIEALAFSPPSTAPSLLASGGVDQTILIWDVATGKLLHRLVGHERTVCCLAFSPDGETLLSASREPNLRIWSTATWQEQKQLIGHNDVVYNAAFSPDGATIVSASFDKTVRLWDSSTGKLRRTLYGHTGWVHGVACSPDGVTVASGGADQTVRLWDTRSGHALHILSGRSDWTPALAFTPDGETLVSGNWDHSVRVWDMRNNQIQHTFRGHTDRVTAVACSPDGQIAASGSADSTVRLWELHTRQERQVLRGHTAGVSGVAFHPAGGMLASSSQDGTVRVWHLPTGQLIHMLTAPHTDDVTAVVFSPDGRTLVSGSRDRTVRMWSVDDWHLIRTFEPPAPAGRIWSLAFNHDGSLLAAGSNEGMIDLWWTASGSLHHRLVGHTNLVSGIAFTPNRCSLASCSEDTTIRLWSLESGEQQRAWTAHAIRTMAVAFRPTTNDHTISEPILASSGCDEAIKLWDSSSGECVQTLRAAGPYQGMHIAGVTSLTDSQRLALIALGAVET